MTEMTIRGLLVGMRFRPPSLELLRSMKSGHQLILVADPCGAETGTPHSDPQAVAVYVELDVEDLMPIEAQLIASGWSIGDLISIGTWHIGYCAKATNKEFAQKRDNLGPAFALRGCEEIPFESGVAAQLEWGPNGEPLVKITI